MSCVTVFTLCNYHLAKNVTQKLKDQPLRLLLLCCSRERHLKVKPTLEGQSFLPLGLFVLCSPATWTLSHSATLQGLQLISSSIRPLAAQRPPSARDQGTPAHVRQRVAALVGLSRHPSSPCPCRQTLGATFKAARRILASLSAMFTAATDPRAPAAAAVRADQSGVCSDECLLQNN